jgi:hypothetical protein
MHKRGNKERKLNKEKKNMQDYKKFSLEFAHILSLGNKLVNPFY